jgi:hypothetical protein
MSKFAIRTASLALAINLATALPSVANEDVGANTDIEQYALAAGVSMTEAGYRLRLQEDVGYLRSSVAESAKHIYGGLYIEHSPRYRVVVQHVGSNVDELQHLVGASLAAVVEYEEVSYTEADLFVEIHRLHEALGQGAHNLYVDTIGNRIVIEVLSAAAVDALTSALGVRLPTAAEFEIVDELPTPALTLRGGLHLSTCTSGFTIYKSTSTNRMITTAGHCPNSQSYAGYALTYQNDQATGGGQDAQSHKRSGASYTNTIRYDEAGQIRSITDEELQGNMGAGDFVCKYGKVTGYDCGYIVSRGHLPCGGNNTHYTALKVDSDPNGTGKDMAEDGDSGGPYFLGAEAWGTTSCQQGYDAIFVAIDTTENGLGAYLLKSP